MEKNATFFDELLARLENEIGRLSNCNSSLGSIVNQLHPFDGNVMNVPKACAEEKEEILSVTLHLDRLLQSLTQHNDNYDEIITHLKTVV